jgi:hypothetical protein
VTISLYVSFVEHFAPSPSKASLYLLVNVRV